MTTLYYARWAFLLVLLVLAVVLVGLAVLERGGRNGTRL